MRLRPVKVRRVDWFRVLADIRAAGLTLRVVTALTDISKSTLLDLRNQDADPKTHQGELLLTLWVKVTGQAMADVPRWGDPRTAMKRSYIDAWEGGTIHCPLCGTEHSVRAAKKVREPEPVQPNESQMALPV